MCCGNAFSALQITPAVAEEFLRTVDHEQLRVQLDCLGDRDPKNPAAVFIKAVREGWQLPTQYMERIEEQNRATGAPATTRISQSPPDKAGR